MSSYISESYKKKYQLKELDNEKIYTVNQRTRDENYKTVCI